MRNMRTFHEYNIEQLKDIEYASLYLTVALADFEVDHDIECFLQALRDVTEAQGGIGALAKRTNLNRQNLYKLLSAKRQPKIETLGTILDGLGFRLSVVLKDAPLIEAGKD